MNFLDSIMNISEDPLHSEGVIWMTQEQFEQWEKETEKRLYMELWNELDEESKETIRQNQLLYYQRKNKGKATASSPSSSTLPTNPPTAPHTPSHLIPSKATPTPPVKDFPPPPPLQPPLVPEPVFPTPPAQEVPKQSEDTIEDFRLKVDLGSVLNKINVPVPLSRNM
jgi:hypothetical protein